MNTDNQTISWWIRHLRQYPEGTFVTSKDGQLVLVDHAGNEAVKLLQWAEPRAFHEGMRIRKPGYQDTGTVEKVDVVNNHPSTLVFVRWDYTGASWERTDDIGIAVIRIPLAGDRVRLNSPERIHHGQVGTVQAVIEPTNDTPEQTFTVMFDAGQDTPAMGWPRGDYYARELVAI